MTVYNWICLLGIPAMVAGLWAWVKGALKSIRDKNTAVELGVQALLRSQMIAEYQRWLEKGFAPIYARENFENCYTKYHALGANGVMDDIRAKFLSLPTRE